ncbi:MAG: radical SAM protein [Eubacteriales bacterium]
MLKATVFNLQKFSIHDGAGIRTDVFFQGCNLRCGWCANPESQPLKPLPGEKATEYTVDELVAELVKDKPFYDESGGGVTLTGGEPMLHEAFVLALVDALHREGIHVAIETAACVSESVFSRIISAVDFVYIDLKHYGDDQHRAGTGVGNALVLRNIAAALSGETPVVIRIPVIPGFNDSAEDFQGFTEALTKLGVKECSSRPFHQLGENKYRRLKLAMPMTASNRCGRRSRRFYPALTRAGLSYRSADDAAVLGFEESFIKRLRFNHMKIHKKAYVSVSSSSLSYVVSTPAPIRPLVDIVRLRNEPCGWSLVTPRGCAKNLWFHCGSCRLPS